MLYEIYFFLASLFSTLIDIMRKRFKFGLKDVKLLLYLVIFI